MATTINQTWRQVRNLLDTLREHGVVIDIKGVSLEMWATDDDLEKVIDALRTAKRIKNREANA